MLKSLIRILAVFTALFFLGACAAAGDNKTDGPTGGSSLTTYAGSDPKGDYIVVEFDTANSLVRRINITTGETNGWFAYTTLPYTSQYANGFGIVKKAIITNIGPMTNFVLFTEFPQAACVYMIMLVSNGVDTVIDNPAYVVYRQTLSGSDLYGKAYNWMKFTIDSIGSNSDMECGFASYDASANNGRMFGAGYSRKQQTGQDISNCGFNDIDSGDNMYVTNFTYNSDAVSLTMWTGSVGDWTRAISMTGTASGAIILDFGTNCGGGSGLAFPQSSLAANPTTWWSTVGGTYFTVIYEYNSSNYQSSVNPIKINVGSGGRVRVYQFADHISDTPFFDQVMTMMSNAGTNQSPATTNTVCQLMTYFSENSNAVSSAVQNAHYALGSYLYASSGIVLYAMFDPEGRFMSFTMYEDMGGGYYTIRFGFGIKDSAYNDSF